MIAVLESPSIDERKLAADLRAKYDVGTNTLLLVTMVALVLLILHGTNPISVSDIVEN